MVKMHINVRLVHELHRNYGKEDVCQVMEAQSPLHHPCIYKHNVKLWADYCLNRVFHYVIVNQVIKYKLTMGRLPESPAALSY